MSKKFIPFHKPRSSVTVIVVGRVIKENTLHKCDSKHKFRYIEKLKSQRRNCSLSDGNSTGCMNDCHITWYWM